MSSFPTLSTLAQDRQHKRILRLSFPHNDGPSALLLANRLEADESLSRDFEFTVEVLSDNAEIALKDVQGKMVTIELVRGDGRLRYFNGYVFAFRLDKTDGALVFYTMTLKPWLAYLTLRKNNYLFHGRTLFQQAEKIFADYGTHADWDSRVGGPDPAMTMACQFDEDDHNYLHRRWEAAGWFYWYEHRADGHQLIISDDSVHAAPVDGAAPGIAYQRHAGSKSEDGIGDWAATRGIVAGQAALSSFNFKQPVPGHVHVPTLNRQGEVLDIESYEYAGAYGYGTLKGGEALARLRMEEIETRGKQFDAGGNNRFVMPGRWFALTGHFSFGSDDGKNEFLVVSVRHRASNNYLQNALEPSDYSNRLTCVRKSVAWRPGRGFNSIDSKIHGPQTAIVTGPADQEIHTDEYGRVRVRFHWDRNEGHGDQGSAWVRVASSWAGGNFGAVSLPRVGQEVLVQWLDSNPDRPIITGRVFNSDNMAPWELPTQQALSGIRSSELRGGGHNGGRNNHLLMDDTAGQIQAVLSSDHYRSQLSLGYLTRVRGTAGRDDHRGEGYELRTDGWGALRAAKGILLTAWGQAVQDSGTTQQDNTEGADTLRAVLDSAENRSKAAAMASEQRGDKKHGHRGLDTQKPLNDAGWSLAQPIVFITAPDGVATSTPKSIVQAAGQDLGSYAAGNLDMTAGEVMSFSAAKGLQQHVERGGMSTALSHGDYFLHVQDGKTEVVSKKGIMLEAKSGDIVLKTRGGSIVLTESGEILIKGAKEAHDIAGKIELGAAQVVNAGSVGAPPESSFWGQMNIGKFSQQMVFADVLHQVAGKAAGYAYKILTKDGAVLKTGTLDEEGKTERVFTEDMEELHVEIDVNQGKWQILEDIRHEIDELTDDTVDTFSAVGVDVLAEQAKLPPDVVKGLFMDDGKVDPTSTAMLLLQAKLKLPLDTIIGILKKPGRIKPLEILGDMAERTATQMVEERINDTSAKLVALLDGVWNGGDIPGGVEKLFEKANTLRRQAMNRREPTEHMTDLDFGQEFAVLSEMDTHPVDFDVLPSDHRSELA
ncbi:type VI secretion system Vgr family protein [Janthinobacterium agaricidamnosum]|uniref:Rhs element Vgr family protein n=1 Tax=Janthinobacterium agaricidamnosum NBRC 102515 = DSM 9628 TaxID=1349767 RepID=W0V5R4_9BURK|nr:type VI secretion system tip protein VgrG [Janthinobacterium agaricidamnosum]CDG83226.1 rhs element Vgr family protein [Janthinobacterium agaricidamnosum NBRC 102515 = DSM 9628]